ncbi:hypothetical protein C7212DRAFT_364167 [Tuber magnatum]|uniref:Uncharacterized protein n=1 Tax=Tuber magnatum TaxID=42249 RepID=A0A317SM76_9PEZI|nr:hypothetical protein C7212DRAFT_364167 [Tuber magnatum]
MPAISITSATIHGPESLINPLLKWYRTCQSAYDVAPENDRVWELINTHTNDGLNTLQAEELISHLRFRRAESCRIEHLMSEMGYPPRKPFEEFTRRDVVAIKQSFRDVIHLHTHCVYSPLIGRSDAAAFETIFPETWTEALPKAWYFGNVTDDYGSPEPLELGSGDECDKEGSKEDSDDADTSEDGEHLARSCDEGDSGH